MAESKKGIKESLDEGERGERKTWLKTEHSKKKIMASSPISSWQIDWQTIETMSDFIVLGSKITAVTEAMKLKTNKQTNTCSLKEKL